MNTSIQTIIINKNIHYYKKLSYGTKYKKIEYFYDIILDGDIKETLCHNYKNPAVIIYSNNKITKLEYWYKGKLHKKYGPAIIILSNNKIIDEYWYHYGEKLLDTDIQSIKIGIDRKIKINKLLKITKR